MLDPALWTPSCPVSASGGGHAWLETMASCNQLPYQLDMRGEKRCHTSGAGWRGVHLLEAWLVPFGMASLGKDTAIPPPSAVDSQLLGTS